MKRLLIALFSLCLCLTALGINMTNYPSTNAFDSSMWFLLSKPSAPTNFNLPGNYVASTSDLNGASNSIIAQFPTTNGFVDGTGLAYLASNNVFTVSNSFQSGLTVGTNVTVVPYLSTSSIKLEAGGVNTVVVTNGKVIINNGTLGAAQVMNVGGRMGIGGSLDMASSGYYVVLNTEYIRSDASERLEISKSGSAPFLYLSSAATGNSVFPGTLTATNGINLMVKPSFTTNFTCTTNLQTYLCNGTNQLVTLPNAAYVPNVIYRFTSTNGFAKFTITNATGAQTIRDGTSLYFTQVGIGSPSFFSDGAHWWPAARTKVIMPSAQFSCSTNIPLTLANTAYPVTFDSTDFNNSQGIVLALGTNGTHYSKMWITNAGEYQFAPSVVQIFNGNDTIRFWFRSSNTNIPNSCTPSKGQNGSVRVITVPFVVNVTEPTDFEIWAESDTTGEELLAGAASGNYPAAPSVICPIWKISDTYP